VFAQQRHGRFAAKERPGQIDLKHPAPVAIGCLQQRREHRNASVVDKRIEPAEVAFGFGECAGDGDRIGNVTMQAQNIPRRVQRVHTLT
jgi:hypothetical protein